MRARPPASSADARRGVADADEPGRLVDDDAEPGPVRLDSSGRVQRVARLDRAAGTRPPRRSGRSGRSRCRRRAGSRPGRAPSTRPPTRTDLADVVGEGDEVDVRDAVRARSRLTRPGRSRRCRPSPTRRLRRLPPPDRCAADHDVGRTARHDRPAPVGRTRVGPPDDPDHGRATAFDDRRGLDASARSGRSPPPTSPPSETSARQRSPSLWTSVTTPDRTTSRHSWAAVGGEVERGRQRPRADREHVDLVRAKAWRVVGAAHLPADPDPGADRRHRAIGRQEDLDGRRCGPRR